MSNSRKKWLYSVLIFAALIVGPGTAMSIVTREPLEGTASLVIGILEALLAAMICSGICRNLDRLPGVIVGSVMGLAIPPMVAWIGGQCVMYLSNQWPMARLPDPLSLWIGGLIGSIPSAIAGAIVGFIQSDSFENAEIRDLNNS